MAAVTQRDPSPSLTRRRPIWPEVLGRRQRVIAVWLREFGGPEMLVAEETPEPFAGPDQALIQVHVVNVAFIETQLRAGRPGPYRLELPTIPGNGVVGGVVSAVGAGANPVWMGRRVVASTGGSGGYAARVAVDAAALIAVPDALELHSAVAMLADGRTALMLLDTAAVGSGERVLIEAAAGGVGTALVQLTKAAGATVVAAAGGAAKLALVRGLGADVVVDYLDPEWAAQVRAAVGGVDVVFDGVGGAIARAAFELLDRGGRMVSFGLASGSWADVSEEIAADHGIALLRAPRPSAADVRAYAEGAPQSFNAVYATGTCANTDAIPATAAARHTRNPTATPSREMSPAPRPWVRDRETR